MSDIPYKTDRHGGVLPDMEAFSGENGRFGTELAIALNDWSEAGLRFAWLTFPLQKATLIAEAVAQGFVYHHIEQESLVMLKQLAADAEGPPDASHYVGVGGVVINARDELLVIKERYFNGRPAYYKLPGGFVNAGEHLVAAVVREVWEETAVKTKFHSLIGLRHWHVNRFGKSDFYFICRLLPLSLEIQRQESEITECRWMPVEQFLQHEQVSPFNKNFVALTRQTSGMAAAVFADYPGRARQEEIELFFTPDTA